MADEADGEDKTEEASGRKLQQAREKGDVAKSGDLPQALSLIGACAIVAMKGPELARTLTGDLLPFLAHPEQLLGSLEGDGGIGIARAVVMDIIPILLMVMGASMALGVFGNVMQTGLMFTPSKLAPDFSKLNPMTGLKKLFGVDAFITFGKTLLKLTITGIIVWMVVKNRLTDILALTAASEHMTAIMAHSFFERREILQDTDPRIRAMYAWHAIEEIEHKAVAFDVMQKAAHVGYLTRILAMLHVSWGLPLHTFIIMAHMFKVDGFSFGQRLRLWARGLWWLYKPGGLYLPVVPHYLSYFRPGRPDRCAPTAAGWIPGSAPATRSPRATRCMPPGPKQQVLSS